MLTIKCRISLETRSLPIESMNDRSLILPFALVDIQPLSCEYGFIKLKRTKLNGMQDLNSLPCLTPDRTDKLWEALQSHTTTSRTIVQKISMRVSLPVFARIVHRCLQHHWLWARRLLLRLPLTMMNTEKWCTEEQSWIQERHNVVFLEDSWFCVQLSDGYIRVWKLREHRTSSACIRYRYKSPAPGVIVWVATWYTTHTSLVWIDSKLNSDRYISDILHV